MGALPEGINKGEVNKVVQLFWGPIFDYVLETNFLSYSFPIHFLFIIYSFLFISIISYSLPIHFLFMFIHFFSCHLT